MKRALPGAWVLACTAALSACEAPGRPHLATLVSPGGVYEVRLSGRVTRAVLFEKRVRAEVYKQGTLYLPARVIYAAGLFNTSFDDRFGPPEWVEPGVLRFPAEGAPGAQPGDILTVRNVAAQPYRLIRIEATREMFMVLDLPPGGEIRVPLAPPRSPVRSTWFDVLIDSGDAAPMLRGHGTFDPPEGPRPVLAFTVEVSPHGVDVSGGRPVVP